MKILKRVLMLSVLIVALAAPAVGQVNNNKDDKLRRKSVVTFTETDTIRGAILRPGATVVESLRQRYSNLLTIRANFIPEITKSAENL